MNSLLTLPSNSHVGRLFPASSLSRKTASTIWILLYTAYIPLLPLVNSTEAQTPPSQPQRGNDYSQDTKVYGFLPNKRLFLSRLLVYCCLISASGKADASSTPNARSESTLQGRCTMQGSLLIFSHAQALFFIPAAS